MSLSNPSDVIIPNTTGLITAMSREANQFSARKDLHTFIGGVDQVYGVLSGRAAGKTLNSLVNPSRISDEMERIAQNTKTNKPSAYESWFRDN